MPLTLTARDVDILEVLTLRVRVLSVSQIANFWWSAPGDAAETGAGKRLAQLAESGLVERFTSVCHPLLPLAMPVVLWRPGEPTPDFAPLAYRLQARWTKPPVPLPSFIATTKAGARFGGHGGRKPKLTEQAHDLHLSAVYLAFRHRFPERAALWRSERWVKEHFKDHRRSRIPDAMLADNDTLHVVEFGGAYSRKKLEAFHSWCRFASYSYEVW